MNVRAALRPFLSTLAAPALLITLGSLPIALDDPQLAARTAARSLAATTVLLVGARTLPVMKWVAQMSRVGWLAPLADVALLTHRLIHSLAETARTTDQAQRMRLGAASWRARFRSAECRAAQLLPASIRRAKALERALDCRLAGAVLKVVA